MGMDMKTSDAQHKTPSVMAFIGEDDPNRGDSKGAIGLSRLVAEMIGGRYVYLDKDMLDKSFPNIKRIKDQLDAYIKTEGPPAIIIGSTTPAVADRAPFVINDINEGISNRADRRAGWSLIT